MRIVFALAFSAALSGMPRAADCPLHSARYIQPDSPWVLTFQRIPRYGPATQIAAFALELPNAGVTLDGMVTGSMGFGSPLWFISGPCSPESAESCDFLMDGQSPPIYGMYDGTIGFLDVEPAGVAPEQIILPQLTASLWYSMYRESEWDGDTVQPSDAFVLEGCD